MRFRQVKHHLEETVISAGRKPDSVKLVGVTKTVEPQTINAVLDDGLQIIGENRVQEFLEKKEQYHLSGVRVHFIGSLQRNKVKYIIDAVDMIESVDSLPLAEEISRRAVKAGRIMPVLLEINIDRQESKSGFLPEDALQAVRQISLLEGVSVQGLMSVPDPARTPHGFQEMQKLFQQLAAENIPHTEMKELSMGMTADYEQAVLYGATMVRVGRGIFGPRRTSENKDTAKS